MNISGCAVVKLGRSFQIFMPLGPDEAAFHFDSDSNLSIAWTMYGSPESNCVTSQLSRPSDPQVLRASPPVRMRVNVG